MVLESSRDISAYIRTRPAEWLSEHRFDIHYRDEYGNLTIRTISDISYFSARDGREFLRAWCELRGAERTFRVDRIERLSVDDSLAERPDADTSPLQLVTPSSASPSPHAINTQAPPVSEASEVHTMRPSPTSARPAATKKKRHRLLVAVCAAAIILVVRGYFNEQESGSFSTPSKLHRVLVRARESRTSYGSPSPASASQKADVGDTANVYKRSLDRRTERFEAATGISSSELTSRYASADRNRDGKLSWNEISAFQAELYRSYAYRANDTALRPDEFLELGGGDCEDWSLVTAGLLRFWGYEAYIGSIRSPDDRQAHAVCLFKTPEKPSRFLYYHFENAGSFNGTYVGAGYYIPIDYDSVGNLTNAVGAGWELRRMYVPEKIYGALM